MFLSKCKKFITLILKTTDFFSNLLLQQNYEQIKLFFYELSYEKTFDQE